MFGVVMADGVNPLIPRADCSAVVTLASKSYTGASPVFLTASLTFVVVSLGIFTICVENVVEVLG
jgi:hypothetical protein